MAQQIQNRREALRELAQNDETRSYTAQVRDLYDVIENALGSGVSRTVIHQKLVDTGMTISLRNFDQALYRIRKSMKGAVLVKQTMQEKNASAPASSSKGALLETDKVKPEVNFRQSLKQIRDEVENIDWAKEIRQPSKLKQP